MKLQHCICNKILTFSIQQSTKFNSFIQRKFLATSWTSLIISSLLFSIFLQIPIMRFPMINNIILEIISNCKLQMNGNGNWQSRANLPSENRHSHIHFYDLENLNKWNLILHFHRSCLLHNWLFSNKYSNR